MNPEPVDFSTIAPVELGAEANGHAEAPVPKPRGKAKPAPQPTGVEPEAPQNIEAEEHCLGAMLISAAAIDAVSEEIVQNDFYRESHGKIFRAAIDLHATGAPVDAITLAAYMQGQPALQAGGKNLLAEVGGKARIVELAALVPSAGNARHYAKIVREASGLRALIRISGRAERMGKDRIGESRELFAQLAVLVSDAQERYGQNGHPFADRALPASVFLERAGEAKPLWGDEGRMLAASGETTIICGPQGVGKTTLAQRYVLARCGFAPEVIGLKVHEAAARTVYIAADRPDQAARSFNRMARGIDRAALDERLVFWKGPPPFNLMKDYKALAAFAKYHGASDVVLDSLKDFAPGLAADDIGALLNRALQEALASDIQILALHHQRKAQQGMPKPKHLDDVYGSTWITSGAGSVLLMWGKAGDTIVELEHLKQPAEPVGPLKIVHNHVAGSIAVAPQMGFPEIVAKAGPAGITAKQCAMLFFGSGAPDANQVERCRTGMERLVGKGELAKIESDVDHPAVRYRINEP